MAAVGHVHAGIGDDIARFGRRAGVAAQVKSGQMARTIRPMDLRMDRVSGCGVVPPTDV